MTPEPNTTGPSRFRFRAWDKAEQKMYVGAAEYGVMLVNGGDDASNLLKLSFGSTLHDDFEVETLDYGHKLQDWVVMQSTGLTDKNGKEIFEGDVVKRFLTDGTIHGRPVQFFSGGFWCNGERMDDTYVYEVIGNIYQNPELLK